MRIDLEGYHLTKVSKDDAQGIHHLMVNNARRFQRYFPKTLQQNMSTASSETFVQNKIREFNLKIEFLYTIADNVKVIGLVYIKEVDWHKKQAEFAYCLASGHEGKGVMTKAIDVLSLYAFAELDLETLQIIVHKDNVPSVNVAKRCSFVWKRTLLKEYTPPNEAPLDMELYELHKK